MTLPDRAFQKKKKNRLLGLALETHMFLLPFPLMPSAQIFHGECLPCTAEIWSNWSCCSLAGSWKGSITGPSLLKIYFTFTFCICKSMPHLCKCLWKLQDGVGSKELQLQTIEKHLTWVLKSKLLLSWRAANALDWAIAPASRSDSL